MSDDTDTYGLGITVEDLVGATPSFSRKSKRADDRPSAREVLAELALDKVMDKDLRSRLVNGKVRALVVEVPEGTWVHPVLDAIDAFVDFNPYKLARTTVPKASDRGDARLADHLRAGRTVISASPDTERALPELLLSVADARVTVGLPDGEMVMEAIKRAQGGRVPPRARVLSVEALTFEEITSVIVEGGNAAESVERLEMVIASKAKRQEKGKKALPKLVDAIEFGAARQWALDLRDDLADARAGKIGWDQVDKGCVLHGPPGTGKTLLAQMLGEACGVETVVASVAQFFATSSGYLDGVIKAQRKVFADAKAKAPCILFLDELNAMPNTDTVGDRNKDYWMPVILDFYTLLDGAMSNRDGVIVVGATNRIEDIHPAILRPGRLERAIYVGPPDPQGVERIMRHHLGDDIAGSALGPIAQLDSALGATGAVIMEQVRAARRRARRAGRPLELADLMAQVVEEETRDEQTVRRTAVHEAGHALVGLLTGAPLESVTIMAFGDAGGGTQFTRHEAHFRTRADYENQVMTLLAGRAAEELLMDAPSQGAGGADDSDLARATATMAGVFASVGLGDSLLYRASSENVMTMMAVDRFLEMKVHKAMAEIYDRTMALLAENRSTLVAIADELLVKRFMDRSEVESVMAKPLHGR